MPALPLKAHPNSKDTKGEPAPDLQRCVSQTYICGVPYFAWAIFIWRDNIQNRPVLVHFPPLEGRLSTVYFKLFFSQADTMF